MNIGCQRGTKKRKITAERGSVTMLSAGALVLACLLSLVAVDFLRVLQAKARAQTAADAAALAAARELAIPSVPLPRDAAAQYAGLNGATLRSCVCERGSSEAIVEVEVPVRLVFLSPTRPLVGRARAVVEGARSPP
jgi:secretion/DNA translocation related TadE-like protein